MYIEKRKSFRKEPLSKYNQKIQEMEMQTSLGFIGLQRNPALYFVINFVKVIERIGLTVLGIVSYILCLGLFAGISLIHTLAIYGLKYIRTVTESGVTTLSQNDVIQIFQRYGTHARIVAICYYIVFIVVLLGLFEVYDIGRPTKSCVTLCLSFRNGALSTTFLFIGFVISNAMYHYDFRLHSISMQPAAKIEQLINESPDDINSLIQIWSILDASRTAFIIASWLFAALCAEYKDSRMQQSLLEGYTTNENRLKLSNPYGDGKMNEFSSVI